MHGWRPQGAIRPMTIKSMLKQEVAKSLEQRRKQQFIILESQLLRSDFRCWSGSHPLPLLKSIAPTQIIQRSRLLLYRIMNMQSYIRCCFHAASEPFMLDKGYFEEAGYDEYMVVWSFNTSPGLPKDQDSGLPSYSSVGAQLHSTYINTVKADSPHNSTH